MSEWTPSVSHLKMGPLSSQLQLKAAPSPIALFTLFAPPSCHGPAGLESHPVLQVAEWTVGKSPGLRSGAQGSQHRPTPGSLVSGGGLFTLLKNEDDESNLLHLHSKGPSAVWEDALQREHITNQSLPWGEGQGRCLWKRKADGGPHQ